LTRSRDSFEIRHVILRALAVTSVLTLAMQAVRAEAPLSSDGGATPVPPSADELARIADEVAARERAASMAIRGDTRFGIDAGLVLAVAQDVVFAEHYHFESGGAVYGSVAASLRLGLSSSFDLHARTGIALPIYRMRDYVDVGADETRGAAECRARGFDGQGGVGALTTTSAFALAWTTDATLRAHVAGAAVPFWIGLGPRFELLFASGEGEADATCVRADTDDSERVSYPVSGSEVTAAVGAVFEYGFDFGSREELELAFRFALARGLGARGAAGDPSFTIELTFGAILP